MATKTRYLGTCPCCGKTFKVQKNKLVLHGYNRPGWGYVVGDCFGAHKTAHELSDETAQAYATWLGDLLKGLKEQLAVLPTLNELTYMKPSLYGRDEAVTVKRGEPRFDSELRSRESRLTSQIRMVGDDIERLNALVASWEPKELGTVEEQLKEKAASKAERDAQRAAKKAQKVADQVAKFQKRIDSAVRRNNTKVLAEVWSNAQRKLRELSGYELTYAEALKMLDRDAVWAQHGLEGMVLSHYKTPWNERPETPVLDKMTYTEEELARRAKFQAEQEAYLAKINGRG